MIRPLKNCIKRIPKNDYLLRLDNAGIYRYRLYTINTPFTVSEHLNKLLYKDVVRFVETECEKLQQSLQLTRPNNINVHIEASIKALNRP